MTAVALVSRVPKDALNVPCVMVGVVRVVTRDVLRALGAPGGVLQTTPHVHPGWRDALAHVLSDLDVTPVFLAGIPVLAGTDTNYPDPQDGHAILNAYAGHGITLHHELALLVQAGLSAAETLAADTSVPARLFGLTDRGRIAPGLRADLLLVGNDPCADITATRNIAGIWRNGTRLHR
jgi:imidazolonepropionase-like amidohydrolase